MHGNFWRIQVEVKVKVKVEVEVEEKKVAGSRYFAEGVNKLSVEHHNH